MTAARAERSTAHTYRLTCVACSYETTVKGNAFDALTAADAHQDEYEDTQTDHFVNFRIADNSGPDR